MSSSKTRGFSSAEVEIKPLWKSGEKKAAREFRKLERQKHRAKFVVEYDLIYEDGDKIRWDGYYRTYTGARAAIFWNLYFGSWGGSAEIYPYPTPVPPPTVGPKDPAGESKLKGIFRGRK